MIDPRWTANELKSRDDLIATLRRRVKLLGEEVLAWRAADAAADMLGTMAGDYDDISRGWAGTQGEVLRWRVVAARAAVDAEGGLDGAAKDSPNA